MHWPYPATGPDIDPLPEDAPDHEMSIDAEAVRLVRNSPTARIVCPATVGVIVSTAPAAPVMTPSAVCQATEDAPRSLATLDAPRPDASDPALSAAALTMFW